jgi:hypothetical protein
MIRIGLSGTNWTRKTTTIQQLARRLAPVPVDIVSLSPLVEQCPFPMGPAQTLDGSKWMVERVGQILERPVPLGTVQIFDRTPLDILAFTLHANERAGHAFSATTSLLDAILSLSANFMLIFLCWPADEWPAPEAPSVGDVEFALSIDRLLRSAAQMSRSAIAELPWPIEARVHQMVQVVSNR